MTREEFVARWTSRKADFGQLGAIVDAAKLCIEVLADFDAVTTAQDETLLTLREAAAQSGYSTDHLRRLARQGRLPCVRRGRRLLFRAGSIPRRATVIDARPVKGYDAAADARQVAARSS